MPDSFYTSLTPFGDTDIDIKLREVSIVKTNKPHECMMPSGNRLHRIPVGSKVLVESCLIDGHFSRCYLCLKCLDSFYLDDMEFTHEKF